MSNFSLTKEQKTIGAGWLVFMLIFWLIGAGPKMTKAEAFFGLAVLTVGYSAVVFVARRIFPIGTKK